MLNGLDLFSGIGGITLGLAPWVHPVAYCEGDRYCQGVLLSRMREGVLPPNPEGEVLGWAWRISTHKDDCFMEDPFTCHHFKNNAEFIAHARTDIPALIEEVERLRKLTE